MFADAGFDVINLISQGGMVTLLLVVLIGGSKGWWVFGKYYDEMRADRDKYREMALRSIRTAEKGAEVATKVVEMNKDIASEIADLPESELKRLQEELAKKRSRIA